MTREEAIKIVKLCCPKINSSECDFETAMRVLVPELAESEDERIRKALIWHLKAGEDFVSEGITKKQCLAYLEKQKCQDKVDRMAPIYENQEAFEDALDKAWKYYNESGAKTVDSCEDDYIECVFAKGFREGFLYGKQKETSLSDDDLGTLETWEECVKENKEKWGLNDWFVEATATLVDKVKRIKINEQKPAEWSEEDKVTIDCAVDVIEEAGLPSLAASLKSLRPQLRQEWSEEDKDMLNSCISSIEEAKENRYAYDETDGDTSYDQEISWLKSLRNRIVWKPSRKQIDALVMVLTDESMDDNFHSILVELTEQLKKLLK